MSRSNATVEFLNSKIPVTLFIKFEINLPSIKGEEI